MKLISDFACEQSSGDHTGHDWAHLRRVAGLSQQLLQSYPTADAELVLAAALTHDVLDEKLVADPTVLRQQLVACYRAAGFSAARIGAVLAIIDHLSYSKNLRAHWPLSLEGQLVQDADRLDALGAVGIGRTFYYGASRQAPMYDPQVPPRTVLSHAAYREVSPVLNHFDEKLFKLADLMNTPQAHELALARTALMRVFVTAFKQEWAVGENILK